MSGRAAVLLAGLLGAASLWATGGPLVLRVLGPGPVSASNGADAPLAPPRAVDLGPILDFAPFGRAEAEAEMRADDRAVAGGFVLLGIALAARAEDSRAIIGGGDPARTNFGLGEEVAPGVRLLAVSADHVTLDVAGVAQDLAFAGAGGAEGLAAVPETATAEQSAAGLAATVDQALLAAALAPAPQPEAPVAAGEQEAAVSAAADLARYRTELEQDPPALVERLGLVAEAGGYRVGSPVAEVLRRAGLGPGDLVAVLNGHPLGDPLRDAGLFDEVVAEGQAILSVRRAGKDVLITLPLPQGEMR